MRLWVHPVVSSPPPPLLPPSNVAAKKSTHFDPFCSKSNFVWGGREGVASFSNSTGKVPTLLTSIVYRRYLFEFLLCCSPLQKRQGNWVELIFAKTSGTVTWAREKIANSWPMRPQWVACSAGVFVGRANVLLTKAPCWNSKKGEKMGPVKRSRVGGGEHLPSTYPKGYYFYLP